MISIKSRIIIIINYYDPFLSRSPSIPLSLFFAVVVVVIVIVILELGFFITINDLIDFSSVKYHILSALVSFRRNKCVDCIEKQFISKPKVWNFLGRVQSCIWELPKISSLHGF